MSLIKVGEVTSINAADHTVRVSFPQDNDLVSYDLPVLCRNTYANSDYNLPDIGEDVLCIFLPGGQEEGFVIGSFYAGEVTPPTTTADERKVKFSDDTTVTYNRSTHSLDIIIADTSIHADRENVDVKCSSATVHLDANSLTVDTPSSVTVTTQSATVKANTITLDAPETKCTGHLSVANGVSVTGGSSATASITGSISQTGGDFITDGDVTASGISLIKHTHTGVHGETSTPN